MGFASIILTRNIYESIAQDCLILPLSNPPFIYLHVGLAFVAFLFERHFLLCGKALRLPLDGSAQSNFDLISHSVRAKAALNHSFQILFGEIRQCSTSAEKSRRLNFNLDFTHWTIF